MVIKTVHKADDTASVDQSGDVAFMEKYSGISFERELICALYSHGGM